MSFRFSFFFWVNALLFFAVLGEDIEKKAAKSPHRGGGSFGTIMKIDLEAETSTQVMSFALFVCVSL